MIGRRVMMGTTMVEVVACQMDHRGNWCVLVVDGDGKLHASEYTALRMMGGTPAPLVSTHHESPGLLPPPLASGGLPSQYAHQVFSEAPPPAPVVVVPVVPGVQKYLNGTKVRRKPSIDPPMPEAIFYVELYKPAHGMRDQPRYWGRRTLEDPHAEMEGAYEHELELMPVVVPVVPGVGS